MSIIGILILIINFFILISIFIITFFNKNKNLNETSIRNIIEIENERLAKNYLDKLSEIKKDVSGGLKDLLDSLLKQSIQQASFQADRFKYFGDESNKTISNLEKVMTESMYKNRTELQQNLKSFQEQFNTIIKTLSDTTDIRLEKMRGTIEKKLDHIQTDNNQKLEKMRETVDEKLQSTLEKRMGESFKQVSERLEQVHKGLGEMQNIAMGVGDLKKVLTNVKTRGILGEYQLENILEQILSPEQYSKNVATKKGSQANVEFAIKMPGKSKDKEVWIPIDSKFPIENYESLLKAYEDGDKKKIEETQKLLFRSIENFAKNIQIKYIDPPHTTDFAIMFLPIEGLYAEVTRNTNLFQKLQREYKITTVGPTNLAAFLSSLQVGFRTLAIQKRSSEVWNILSGVKKEFSLFEDILNKTQQQITKANTSLDDLVGKRTRAINKKLSSVEDLSLSNQLTHDVEVKIENKVTENTLF